jgi:hypothetical protein
MLTDSSHAQFANTSRVREPQPPCESFNLLLRTSILLYFSPGFNLETFERAPLLPYKQLNRIDLDYPIIGVTRLGPHFLSPFPSIYYAYD